MDPVRETEGELTRMLELSVRDRDEIVLIGTLGRIYLTALTNVLLWRASTEY